MKLNWNRKLFRRVSPPKRKITGFNVVIPYMSANFRSAAEGLVMWVKNSKIRSVNSTFVVTTYTDRTRIFTNISAFLSGGFRFVVLGCTFKKLVKCSRLTKHKLMKMKGLKKKN